MSGHSKWAQTKRQKAVTDAKRGKIFTKLANGIAVAAKTGGGADPETNSKLRFAIEKARAASMPADNIKRAIERAAGPGAAATEEVVYEGYAPGGVAIVVEAATDNRNRTAADVRSAFTKNGGKLGESGSVAWLFDPTGLISLTPQADRQAQMLSIIDAGAVDVEDGGEVLFAYTKPEDLHALRQKLESAGQEVIEASLTRRQKNTIPVNDQASARQILNLLDALEEIDEVTETYANYDIPDSLMNAVLAE